MKTKFIKSLNGSARLFFTLFSNLVGMLFGPFAFLLLKYLIVFSISSGVVGVRNMVLSLGLFNVVWKEVFV